VPDDGVWSFEISALTRAIDGDIAASPPDAAAIEFRPRGAAPMRIEVALLEKLRQTWTGTAARGQARLPAGHRLDCVIGLHSVHYVLSDDKDFDAFQRSVRGVAISLRESDRIASWTAPPDVTRVLRNEVRVLDQSLSGYRIQWERLDGLRIRVGELIALAPAAEDGEPQDWMIGAIRWMRFVAEGAMEAGVALLSRRAQPVGVRTFSASRVPRAPMRGLLLEPLADDDGGETILVPHLFDRSAGEVEVMRPADPFAPEPEPLVEFLRNPRVLDRGSAYLQVVIGAPEERDERDPAAVASANDDLALAAGNDH
jgi:hypothetical protein